MPSPRVFISYSWDSEDHKRRVSALVRWLRERGIDAWLDVFETSPAEGWPHWCYRQVERADYVLAVCTELYEQKVMREQPHGTGRGGTWEGSIITHAIYDDTDGQDKFIPVVFSATDADEYVPFFLRGQSIYDASLPSGLDDLYRRLTNQPAVAPTPLGPILQLPTAELEQPSELGVSAPVEPPGAEVANLAEVIEGSWIVDVEVPQGQNVSRMNLSRFTGFEAVGIVSLPGWQARGSWQILPPGTRLMLAGTQTSIPFGPAPIQDIFDFHVISATLLEGISVNGNRATRWTRG